MLLNTDVSRSWTTCGHFNCSTWRNVSFRRFHCISRNDSLNCDQLLLAGRHTSIDLFNCCHFIISQNQWSRVVGIFFLLFFFRLFSISCRAICDHPDRWCRVSGVGFLLSPWHFMRWTIFYLLLFPYIDCTDFYFLFIFIWWSATIRQVLLCLSAFFLKLVQTL